MNLLRRPRRLRSTPQLRALVRETALSPDDFILPLFVSEKVKGRVAVGSMPGVFQLDENELVAEVAAACAEGVRAVLLFGIPVSKDERATQAYAEDGIVQRSLRRLRKEVPGLILITDVCLCEYMSHGHCGITDFHEGIPHVHNDPSVELLVATAVSHARAGADVVAPSDMMDGRIGAMRSGLDAAGFEGTIIMSYAAKFASAFYGPFRDAAESAPQSGDRRSYQMDAANAREALREVELDVTEGADLVRSRLADQGAVWAADGGL
jgi:porphobilinogen synthase